MFCQPLPAWANCRRPLFVQSLNIVPLRILIHAVSLSLHHFNLSENPFKNTRLLFLCLYYTQLVPLSASDRLLIKLKTNHERNTIGISKELFPLFWQS